MSLKKMNDLVQSCRRLQIGRRTLLKGVGVSLALPWMEAMGNASEFNSGTNPSPRRFAALFMPNGVRADKWSPKKIGKNYDLSETLKPIGDLKTKVSVFSNFWNKASDYGDGHYVKTSGFLTCTTIKKSLGIDLNCNGVSIDQVIARKIGSQTPIPSLELGIDPVTVGVDRNVGYTRVYGSHISWSGPTSPVAKEINPNLVYQRLFRCCSKPGKENQDDLLLLDQVLDDSKSLKNRLGIGDRRRLDEYMQSVRSLEIRLKSLRDRKSNPWKPLKDIKKGGGPADPSDHQSHVRLMLDMIALAFASDVSRVSTFMFGNSVSGKNFSFLDGVTGGHHEISHHQNEKRKLQQYQKIATWHVEQYRYLISKLDSMQEGDRTVLDNSLILFGSGLRDGNGHSPRNLPILMAGSAGGRVKTGFHVKAKPNTPLSNIYLTIASAVGLKQKSFADSRSVVKEILPVG